MQKKSSMSPNYNDMSRALIGWELSYVLYAALWLVRERLSYPNYLPIWVWVCKDHFLGCFLPEIFLKKWMIYWQSLRSSITKIDRDPEGENLKPVEFMPQDKNAQVTHRESSHYVDCPLCCCSQSKSLATMLIYVQRQRRNFQILSQRLKTALMKKVFECSTL